MKILILATGGTISHDVTEDGMHVSNARATTGDTFAKILASATRTLEQRVRIKSETILNKDSGNMVMSDWKTIIDGIVRNYDDFDGFIVTHGTETMGYATAAVSFGIQNLGKPVVFTGAQVAYGQVGSDSVMNLENALRFLVEAGDKAKGVFLVFGSHVIAGTRVKKSSEAAYDTFKLKPRFPMVGMIGHSMELFGNNLRRHAETNAPFAAKASELIVKPNFDNQVVVLSEFPGMRSDMIMNLVRGGTKGIILRAYGSGVPNVGNVDAEFENLRPALEFLREKKIPMVITTQAPDARACMSIYEPSFLARELGAIPVNDMGIEAALVKLAWLLGQNLDYEKVCELMKKPMKGEMVEL